MIEGRISSIPPLIQIHLVSPGCPEARCVLITTVLFLDIEEDCHRVYQAGWNEYNPLKNHVYPIDPDQANGVPLFRADCDFKLIEEGGVTIVSNSLIL
jgi:hypothetical protein